MGGAWLAPRMNPQEIVRHQRVTDGAAIHSGCLFVRESIEKVWIFDGVKDVTLIELFGDGGTKFTSNQIVPELLKQAPAEFLRKFPAGVPRRAL